MTLIVSVAGKFYDEIEMLPEKTDSILYQVNEDDPNILSMKLDYEVSCPQVFNGNFMIFFNPFR